MRRLAALAVAAALTGGCSDEGKAPANGVVERNALPPAAPDLAGTTPMAERVAVLGLLNKRNGIVRDLTLRPGQSLRIKDVIVRLRACEASAPWENEKLTGAFVQVDVERPDKLWSRVFSGWLYKESPSLNVVEHAVYDVWPKSCAMNWPGAPGADGNASSSAPNSGGGTSPPPPPAVPSAAESNSA